MATKEKLLTLLEINKGMYFSGEELAKELAVSRAAIWKNVKSLQGEGYLIDAITNKGYCLSESTDILSVQGIQKHLGQSCKELNIEVIPITTSTNTVVREKAVAGQKEGYVLLANEQTSGRGRRGRSFYSPSGTGIYLSWLLRPGKYTAEQATAITTMAAVAVCEAIEAVSEVEAQIKWVNDIFVDGKKVCGILTEASLDMESGFLDYAVLGVGMNIYEPKNGFGADLTNIAGKIFSQSQGDMKNRLVAEFMNHFMMYYTNFEYADYANQYRSRSLAIGKWVNVIAGEQSQSAFVLGIDDDCRLLVKYENGEEETLSSGEISIRLT